MYYQHISLSVAALHNLEHAYLNFNKKKKKWQSIIINLQRLGCKMEVIC